MTSASVQTHCHSLRSDGLQRRRQVPTEHKLAPLVTGRQLHPVHPRPAPNGKPTSAARVSSARTSCGTRKRPRPVRCPVRAGFRSASADHELGEHRVPGRKWPTAIAWGVRMGGRTASRSTQRQRPVGRQCARCTAERAWASAANAIRAMAANAAVPCQQRCGRVMRPAPPVRHAQAAMPAFSDASGADGTHVHHARGQHLRAAPPVAACGDSPGTATWPRCRWREIPHRAKMETHLVVQRWLPVQPRQPSG